jgi:transcriptional regulator with XRE-family HTH domain
MTRRVTEVDVAIGRAIRQRRILLGLGQVEFAGRIGVTHQQAHKYQAGSDRIAASRLVQIAQVLNVEPGELLQPGADIIPDALEHAALIIVQAMRTMTPRRRRVLSRSRALAGDAL